MSRATSTVKVNNLHQVALYKLESEAELRWPSILSSAGTLC